MREPNSYIRVNALNLVQLLCLKILLAQLQLVQIVKLDASPALLLPIAVNVEQFTYYREAIVNVQLDITCIKENVRLIVQQPIMEIQ